MTYFNYSNEAFNDILYNFGYNYKYYIRFNCSIYIIFKR